MTAVVVDTNVLVVASDRAPQAGPGCVSACADALAVIQRCGHVVLDAGSLILNEYLRNALLAGRPGLGDVFAKWVFYSGQWDAERCELVTITPSNGSFREFPQAPELQGFHSDDHKFVAVALASSNNPEVLNAVDSDWWDFREALARHGVHVRFLCPEQFD